MVEIFIKRKELMPSDETVEQHTKRRADEIAEVERDKSKPAGLFKGTFANPLGELYRDDTDGGVIRCRNCNNEHEGGPACQYCGTELDDEGYNFSDDDVDLYDEADLDELDSLDLEHEINAEIAAAHGHAPGFAWANLHHHFVDFEAHDDDDETGSSRMSNSEDDDGSSLDGFVTNDDEEEEEDEEEDEEPVRAAGRRSNNRSSQQSRVIEISDDEDSDEGGVVSNRIPRHRPIVLGSSSPVAPSAISVTDNETTDSDGGETNSEMLRRSGWSPLDQGNDSDAEEQMEQFQFRPGYEFGDEDEDSEDNSDTETMVGNGASDDEDEDRSRSSSSQTPTYGGGYEPYMMPHEHLIANYQYSNASEADDDDSVAGFSSVCDQDGDTEMSVSPRASRSVSVTHDRAVSRDDSEDEESRTSRSMSRSINGGGYGTEELGVANELHEIEDDSEGPVRPPPRRLPRRHNPNATREYDPRISMIFAEHQQSMRGQEPGGLDELDNETRRMEPGPRSRRMTAYRQQPQRRFNPLRASRSPSATRVVATSSRASRGRVPRYYQFDPNHPERL